MPFFSIIINTYNRPTFLINAINSVLNQTFTDFELIIVNDGSTADYSIVENLISGNQKVKYFKKSNEERSIARNFGIIKSRGEYICFLDDDDVYYPNHLETFFKEINKTSVQYFYRTGAMKKNKNGTLRKDALPDVPLIEFSKSLKNTLKLEPLFFSPGLACIPKTYLLKESFNPNLKYWEDIDLWIRLIQKHPLRVIPEFTYEYIMHESNSVSWTFNSIKEKFKTVLFWKKSYSFLPKKFIADEIYNLALAALDFSISLNKREAWSYLKYILVDKRFIFDRRFWGSLKKVVKMM